MSLLKQKRWPFLDGVLLFDYNNTEDFSDPDDKFLKNWLNGV